MSAKEIEAELSQKQNNKSKERHTAPHHRCGRAQNEARRKRGDIKAKACNALLPAGAARQTSLAALGAVAAYAAVRSSIKIFHHTRRHLLRQMLADLCRNLDHVTYWLDFGSLLGIHRDGDLILHDNDVDLAVLDPDWPALLAHLQRQMPQYCVRLETPSEAPDVCFLRVYCGVCFADVFGARSLGEGRVLVDCGHGDITSIDERLVLPTKALTWRDIDISVPADLEGTLYARYGPTWRTPIYMDKGADTIEGDKLYAKVFRALGKVGIRI